MTQNATADEPSTAKSNIFTVTAVYEIPFETIGDLIAYFADDKENFWCSSIKWNATDCLSKDTFAIQITERDGTVHNCTFADFNLGLHQMGELYPMDFSDLVHNEADSMTADILLQLVALKEVRY